MAKSSRSREKVGSRKKSHAVRNISIVVLIGVIVLVAIVASGALNSPTYVMIVHVYDQTKGMPQTVYEFNVTTMAVHNVTVTISGPNYSPTTRGPSPDGIVGWGPDDHLIAGSYQITVSANGYRTNTVSYVLGASCVDRTPDAECHPLVPMTPG